MDTGATQRRLTERGKRREKKMFTSENDRFADQVESIDRDALELVRRLDRYGKTKDENVNEVEQLLIQSRQLNSARSIRLIDQGIEKIPSTDQQRKTHWNLSCNRLGRDHAIDWNALPIDLQVLCTEKETKKIESSFRLWTCRAISLTICMESNDGAKICKASLSHSTTSVRCPGCFLSRTG